jgi:hypothetical protein
MFSTKKIFFSSKPHVEVKFLVIGGGGGGGAGIYDGVGGGGAGGYIEGTYEQQMFAAVAISVGAGGSVDANGAQSVLGDTVASGGGAGGTTTFWDGLIAEAPEHEEGSDGGSGGGGAGARFQDATLSGGSGIAGQGFSGGAGKNFSGVNRAGGGGGGAGAAGQAAYELPQVARAGDGGVGKTSSITGTSVSRAGGGGGTSINGVPYAGQGYSGGGNGGSPGAANTGGGGGGGASGGSGVVILRVPSIYSATFSNGVTHMTASVDGDSVYTVTATTGNETVTFTYA